MAAQSWSMSVRVVGLLSVGLAVSHPGAGWGGAPGGGKQRGAEQATGVDDAMAILLDNGEVLWGTLERLPGKFRIRTGQGSSMVLRRERIVHAGPSLQALYTFQRDRLTAPTVGDHVRLGAWCLQRDLLAQTARHVQLALAQSPQDPAALQLARRLESRQKEVASTPIADTSAGDDLPESDGTPTSPHAALTPAQRDLLRPFAIGVQPHLLRACATHGCHGYGGSTPFSLLRPPQGAVIDGRLTAENLLRLLTFTSSSRQSLEQFERMAFSPHGGIGVAGMERESVPGQRLMEFLHVAHSNAPSSPGGELAARATDEPGTGRVQPYSERGSDDRPRSKAQLEAPNSLDVRVANPFDPDDYHRRQKMCDVLKN